MYKHYSSGTCPHAEQYFPTTVPGGAILLLGRLYSKLRKHSYEVTGT